MGKKNVIVRFRSAMGGFHKGDVSQYVVKLHEEHAAALAELEKKADLIYRKRQGLGKPNLIYVKNFISPDRQVQTRQNDVSGDVTSTIQDMSESHGSNTDNTIAPNRNHREE